MHRDCICSRGSASGSKLIEQTLRNVSDEKVYYDMEQSPLSMFLRLSIALCSVTQLMNTPFITFLFLVIWFSNLHILWNLPKAISVVDGLGQALQRDDKNTMMTSLLRNFII